MRYRRRALGPAVLCGRAAAGALLCAALLTGCATPSLRELAPTVVPGQPRVELVDTPFHPQQDHYCGPAALATVLGAAGAPVAPETLAAQVYVPGREGSLQAELVAAVRGHDRVAVRLGPDLHDLIAALAEKRPVLVLQNLGLRSLPRWHYAVLIGYDDARNELILRSGRQARERLSPRRFLQTWELAERWAVVIAHPAQPPQSVSARAWIAALAPFESLGRGETARQGYEAASARWPREPLVWQALANARYAHQDLVGAQHALEQAVALDPSAPALNNLAQVQLERGCASAARAMLDRIGPAPAGFAAAVAHTRAAVDRRLAEGVAEPPHCSGGVPPTGSRGRLPGGPDG